MCAPTECGGSVLSAGVSVTVEDAVGELVMRVLRGARRDLSGAGEQNAASPFWLVARRPWTVNSNVAPERHQKQVKRCLCV